MSILVQPHMRLEGETPVPCGCFLGYHHKPDGEPLIEHDENGEVVRVKGRHPYCIGACKVWGTPTEEFDFRLVRGRRVSQKRITMGLKVIDYSVPGAPTVSWDDDPVSACEKAGVVRLATWKRREAQ